MNTLKIKKIHSAMLVAATLGLAACGGGGGGESASPDIMLAAAPENTTAEPVTNNTPNSNVEDESATSVSISHTEDLVADQSFLFSSNYSISVMANLDTKYDYLTVCYADETGNDVDYDNCLLRADLDAGVFNGELLLTNDTDSLYVSAWDYEDADNPVVSLWDRSVDGDIISIN